MRTKITTTPADWLPLDRALEAEFGERATLYRESFRFIGNASGPADIGPLRLYRHASTRRYLVLDAAARSYRFHPPSATYGQVDLTTALEVALGLQLR